METDLYKVVKINGNLVDIANCIVNIDNNGNFIQPTIIKNIPVFMMQVGLAKITYNIQVGDLGIYFLTKKRMLEYLKDKKNNIHKSYTYFDKSGGFFLPIINATLNSSADLVLQTTNDITIQAGGNVNITSTKDTIINAVNCNINATGETILTSPNIKLTGETAIEGTTTITGDTTITGNLDVSGIITGSDVMAGGKSGATHTHTSGAPGSPTSPPI